MRLSLTRSDGSCSNRCSHQILGASCKENNNQMMTPLHSVDRINLWFNRSLPLRSFCPIPANTLFSRGEHCILSLYQINSQIPASLSPRKQGKDRSANKPSWKYPRLKIPFQSFKKKILNAPPGQPRILTSSRKKCKEKHSTLLETSTQILLLYQN